jgi:hypothetical protein
MPYAPKRRCTEPGCPQRPGVPRPLRRAQPRGRTVPGLQRKARVQEQALPRRSEDDAAS